MLQKMKAPRTMLESLKQKISRIRDAVNIPNTAGNPSNSKGVDMDLYAFQYKKISDALSEWTDSIEDNKQTNPSTAIENTYSGEGV
jgi:hypothetical protein